MRVRQWLCGALMSVVAAGCQDTSVATEEVVVDLSRRGVEISPEMYGLFLSEITIKKAKDDRIEKCN